jgi:hypothetical protein
LRLKAGSLILESNNPKSKTRVFEDCAVRGAVSNGCDLGLI